MHSASEPQTGFDGDIELPRSNLFVRGSDLGTMREAPLNADWNRAIGAEKPIDDLSVLLDFNLLTEIFDDFLEVSGLPIAIIDLDGRVLTSSKWQRLCTDFHRANKITRQQCRASDTVLSRQVQAGSDCAIYQCANGLTDCATPITIDGVHVANLFTGQFLLAAPDMEFFRRQQLDHGFDERGYFEALAELPIVSQQKIPALLRLLRGLAQQIVRQGVAEKRALSVLAEVEEQVAERTRTLRESEDRFRVLFEGASVGQLLLEPDSLRILECNQAAADIHGYTREELCALSVADFDAALDSEAVAAIRQHVLASGRAQFDTRIRRNDGELRDLSVTTVMLRSVAGNRIHATHIDITARKQAEREQQRLNRALRLLSDCNLTLVNASDERQLLSDICRLVVETGGYLMSWIGVAEQDAAKSVRVVAQSGYEDGYLESIVVSWDEGSVFGRGPTGTAVRTATTQINQDCLANPNMAPWRTAALKRGYRSSIALPLVSQQQTLGALTLYADEPEAFTTDEVPLLEELASNVAFGIQTLRTRNKHEAAEAATQAKSAFLAHMSHEIRTPLHVITGLAHLLLRNGNAPVPHDRVSQLCATSDHLLAIVNDILDLSKIEAGQLVLDRSDFRLGSVVEKVVQMVGGQAQDKGLKLATDFAVALRDMALNGDALRLTQVLINLCSNAVKFTDCGAVHLRIAGMAEDAAEVRLRFVVEDTGIGIAPDEQARLFQAFNQADASLTRERGGTGLGLAISQRLIELMGSTIEVESRVGQGSTFSFDLVLPRAAATTPIDEPAFGAAPADGLYGMSVLLAEDHPLSQEILLEMLEDLGCEVEVASDGAEALDCAKTRCYDLILMDMQMPKMDGLAAARAIRALPGRHDTPIIALTANAFADDRRLCLDAGMNDHLGKPVTPVTLAASLSRWLPAMAMPDETLACDCPLSRALADIPQLSVGLSWRQSPERLADYCRQLTCFVDSNERSMALLRGHLSAGERDAARVLAHDLKGIAGLLGGHGIASLAGDIQQSLLKGAGAADLDAMIDRCEAELQRLAQAVRTLPE